MISAEDRLPVDIAFQKIFDFRLAARDAIKAAAPDLAQELDLATLERVVDGSVPAGMAERHEGSAWKARRLDGGWWMYVLIMLEPETPDQAAMQARVEDYSERLLDEHVVESVEDMPFPTVAPIVIVGGRGAMGRKR